MSRDLCIMACCFCRDPLFHQWMQTKPIGQFLICTVPGPIENAAKEFILDGCNVESRNDLDKNPQAAELFHDLVRKPFLEWKEKIS